jgi:hypothetical protein
VQIELLANYRFARHNLEAMHQRLFLENAPNDPVVFVIPPASQYSVRVL